jgi:Restriction endonuclease NotI
MTRASGNDFAELFGYAPDDTSTPARRQWKSQNCPFVGGTCIKRINLPGSGWVVSGACSVANKPKSGGVDEVIICLQRLYADNYGSLRACVYDAIEGAPPVYLADEYSKLKKSGGLPNEYVVLLGQKSGSEISLQNAAAKLSIDWAMAHVVAGKLDLIIPCEVQSIDTTGSYRDAWQAYANEESHIPNADHGMNWANVWKRLIPQLLLKGAIASTSTLCKQGLYFVVPDRVYVQFEKLVGKVPEVSGPGPGVLTVMTYALGPEVPKGSIRSLIHRRTLRTQVTKFAEAFASGQELLPLGAQLDEKVSSMLASL